MIDCIITLDLLILFFFNQKCVPAFSLTPKFGSAYDPGSSFNTYFRCKYRPVYIIVFSKLSMKVCRLLLLIICSSYTSWDMLQTFLNVLLEYFIMNSINNFRQASSDGILFELKFRVLSQDFELLV